MTIGDNRKGKRFTYIKWQKRKRRCSGTPVCETLLFDGILEKFLILALDNRDIRETEIKAES